ncbi:MAG: hypothetical protein LBP65_00995 [Puniceicoccales bacterium]|nr:hypothetical protein [Puniceicoccales bacterium]
MAVEFADKNLVEAARIPIAEVRVLGCVRDFVSSLVIAVVCFTLPLLLLAFCMASWPVTICGLIASGFMSITIICCQIHALCRAKREKSMALQANLPETTNQLSTPLSISQFINCEPPTPSSSSILSDISPSQANALGNYVRASTERSAILRGLPAKILTVACACALAVITIACGFVAWPAALISLCLDLAIGMASIGYAIISYRRYGREMTEAQIKWGEPADITEGNLSQSTATVLSSTAHDVSKAQTLWSALIDGALAVGQLLIVLCATIFRISFLPLTAANAISGTVKSVAYFFLAAYHAIRAGKLKERSRDVQRGLKKILFKNKHPNDRGTVLNSSDTPTSSQPG